jgi:hypothetical protein
MVSQSPSHRKKQSLIRRGTEASLTKILKIISASKPVYTARDSKIGLCCVGIALPSCLIPIFELLPVSSTIIGSLRAA